VNQTELWDEDQVLSRALAHGLPSKQEAGARLCSLSEKVWNPAETNEEVVHIVVVGGSLTAGTFLECDDGPTSAKSGFTCAWPQRLQTLLNEHAKASNGPRVVVSNLAKGGTTTPWALGEFHRIPTNADLVLVDYDVNDGALLNDIPQGSRSSDKEDHLGSMRRQLVAASEVLLRQALSLSSRPAVVWLDSFAYDGREPSTPLVPRPPDLANASCSAIRPRGYSLTDERRAVMDHYGVPRLSVRDAVWPLPQCPSAAASRPWNIWTCTDTCHHPTAPTHRLIAAWLKNLILFPGKTLCDNVSQHRVGIPFTPVSEGASEIEQLSCLAPLSHVTAQDMIAPSHQGSCWERSEDRPGKWGWGCSSSSSSNSSSVPFPGSQSLTFRMKFSSELPRLTITYLETYENAGQALLHFGDVSADDFSFENLLLSGGSCGFIDSFKRESRYSQEVSKVFWFSDATGPTRKFYDSAFRGRNKCRYPPFSGGEKKAHGGSYFFEADVTLVFSPLSPETQVQRKGDRVKVVSLASC
jgi:hypothetical protein